MSVTKLGVTRSPETAVAWDSHDTHAPFTNA